MKIGVLVSGNGGNLQSIIDCRNLVDVTVLLSSNPKAYGVLRGMRAGVPTFVLPENLKGVGNKTEAEKWYLEKLKEYQVDVVILAGFMKIVTPKFIGAFSGRIFNIHPSLLPKYKGMTSLKDAIDAGESEIGVTVHHVVPDVDSGGFLVQRVFDVPPSRELENSKLWLHIQESRVLKESIRKIRWLKTAAM
jgi:phosphoribosylglycinamide formyltransferase-1